MKDVVHLIVSAQTKQCLKGLGLRGKYIPGPKQILLKDIAHNLDDFNPSKSKFGSDLIRNI